MSPGLVHQQADEDLVRTATSGLPVACSRLTGRGAAASAWVKTWWRHLWSKIYLAFPWA